MKNFKRILSLMVVLALCLSVFAACGAANTDTTTQTPSSTEATTETTAPAVTGVQKPEKITMVIGGGISLSDPEKNKQFEEAVSKAIGIEFESIFDTEGFNRVTLLLASGEKIDVVHGNTSFYAQNIKVSQEIKPEWIADTVNLKQIPTALWARQTASDKLIYGIPYRYYSAWVNWVRKDWLDSLGLAVPTTLDQYVEVARAFTNSDPDKNGKKDTYGFSSSNLWDSLNVFFQPLRNAQMKYVGDQSYYDAEAGKYFSIWLTPEYKEYMRWLRGLVAEGIIDPLAPTNEHEQYYNGFYSGKYGFLTGFAHEADVHADKLKAVSPNAVMIPIAPPEGSAGKGFTANMSDMGFAIMKTCDNPEGVVKYFLDWVHSNEGYNMFCFGPEGMNWKMENGAAVKTADNVSCGLSPQHVILQENFQAIIPIRQEVKDALAINAANVIWGKDPSTRPAPPDTRFDDYYMKCLELFMKMYTGDITVDEGFAQIEAKYTETKTNEWYDELNADLTWAKNWVAPN